MKGLRLVTSSPLGLSKERYDPERDGVSPTILSVWKMCREKARLRLLGWTARRGTASQVFGTVVHAVLERVYGAIQSGKIGTIPSPKIVKQVCATVEQMWRRDNPKADATTLQDMEMVMLLTEAIMPIYFTFWHRDLTKMDWFHLEQYIGNEAVNRAFGRHASHLRGKMDGAFRITGTSKRLWLFETKTKSRLGEQGESNLIDILPQECQTTLYLGALQDANRGEVPAGVLLNIIRRPNFQLKKGESMKAFTARLVTDIQKRPDYYFIRIRMEVDRAELVTQRSRTDAMFTDFLNWYHGEAPHYHNSDACENKYGTCEFLRICARKDFTGMYQRPARRRQELEA